MYTHDGRFTLKVFDDGVGFIVLLFFFFFFIILQTEPIILISSGPDIYISQVHHRSERNVEAYGRVMFTEASAK